MNKIVKKLIVRLDRNIHSKRVDDLLRYFNYFFITIGLLFFSLTIGVIGFMVIEQYNFIEALYMTVITLSTVGFGEVKALSNGGRIFVTLFIIFNVGIFAYSLGNLANFLIQGDYKRVFKDLMIGRKIDKMKNHIIVCGYGRYGESVIQHLLKQDLPCVLIEANIEKIKEIRKKKLITVLEGDATDEETLLEAGVDHAKALITTLPEDADNVYVILSARQANPNLQIISRANMASSRKNLMKAGANNVLVPENIGGFYMSALITKPDIIQVFTEISSIEGSSFRLAEVILDPLPLRLHGKSLHDLEIEKLTGVKIIGTKYEGGPMNVNPSGEVHLKDKMGIVVLGNKEQISSFHQMSRNFTIIE